MLLLSGVRQEKETERHGDRWMGRLCAAVSGVLYCWSTGCLISQWVYILLWCLIKEEREILETVFLLGRMYFTTCKLDSTFNYPDFSAHLKTDNWQEIFWGSDISWAIKLLWEGPDNCGFYLPKPHNIVKWSIFYFITLGKSTTFWGQTGSFSGTSKSKALYLYLSNIFV